MLHQGKVIRTPLPDPYQIRMCSAGG